MPHNILWGRRDEIAYLFEANWPYVGWRIQCLRNRDITASSEEVRQAVEPLRGKYGQDRIALLLRPTSLPATSDEVRGTRKTLADALEKLQALQQSYDAQLEQFREVMRAVYEASQKHRQWLQKEITHRIGNRTQLKVESAAKEKSFIAAQKKLTKANSKHSEAARIELSKSQADLGKCKESLQAEENIISELRKLLTAATKENWSLARDEKKKRLKKLKEIKAELKGQKTEVERLDTLSQDQAAGFARRDLLKFLVEKRAHHNPRQLARAIAGLPEMGCRESFANCRKYSFHTEPHLNFQVFEVIDKAWARRDPEKPRPLVHLLREQISRLPKTGLYGGKRVPNYLYQYLQDNRIHLEQAIEFCENLNPRSHPGEVPYVVTSRFLENVSRQRTSLERILSERAAQE